MLSAKADGGGEAAVIGLAGAGEVECRARDRPTCAPGSAARASCADRAIESGVLDHRQALVVIHREHGVAFRESRAGTNAVSAGHGSDHIHAALAHTRDGWLDHVDLFGAQMPLFACVRIEPAPRCAAISAHHHRRRS